MSARDKYLQWLNKSTHIANFKAAIAVQSIVLVMGTMLIEQEPHGAGIAVLFVGYSTFCAFLANFRYRLACTLVAVPNFAIAALVFFAEGLEDSFDNPVAILWLVSTLMMGVVVTVLSRVSDVPSAAERHTKSEQRGH